MNGREPFVSRAVSSLPDQTPVGRCVSTSGRAFSHQALAGKSIGGTARAPIDVLGIGTGIWGKNSQSSIRRGFSYIYGSYAPHLGVTAEVLSGKIPLRRPQNAGSFYSVSFAL